MLQTVRMRFLIRMILPNIREKRKRGAVSFDGASSEDWKEI